MDRPASPVPQDVALDDLYCRVLSYLERRGMATSIMASTPTSVDLVADGAGARTFVRLLRASCSPGQRAVSEAAAEAKAWGLDAAILIASTSFTDAAREQAAALGCEVVDGRSLPASGAVPAPPADLLTGWAPAGPVVRESTGPPPPALVACLLVGGFVGWQVAGPVGALPCLIAGLTMPYLVQSLARTSGPSWAFLHTCLFALGGFLGLSLGARFGGASTQVVGMLVGAFGGFLVSLLFDIVVRHTEPAAPPVPLSTAPPWELIRAEEGALTQAGAPSEGTYLGEPDPQDSPPAGAVPPAGDAGSPTVETVAPAFDLGEVTIDVGAPAPEAATAGPQATEAEARSPGDEASSSGGSRPRAGGLQIRHKDTDAVLLRFDGKTLCGADLRGAALAGADLLREDLSGADLRGADLSGADLSRACLRGANLRGAELQNAELVRADLTGALLAGANLAGADLRGAQLAQADLSSADLNGANLYGAQLDQANLNGIRSDLQTSWPTDRPAPDPPIRQINVD